MRVTPETRRKTRDRILAVAAKLFREQGFAAVTTRALARAADIGTGTLFNYFATKEALAAAILAEALERATARFEAERRGEEGLAEELFLLCACALAELAPYRSFVGEAVEAALGPARREAQGEAVRARQLELVAGALERHGAAPPSPVTLQLYWTLYLGVLAFWAHDPSPNEEDSLALLDESMRLFAATTLRDEDET